MGSSLRLETVDQGVLILRLVFGLLMAAHGAQKLFGWFGGYGLSAVSSYFEGLGFRPGRLFATAASLSEVVGGLLIATGLLGPVGPALVIAVMIVAAAVVHWPHGLFVTNNGIEVPLLYSVAAVAQALSGPGRYSLDAAIGAADLWTPALVWLVLVLGALGGVANLALRSAPAPVAQH